MIVLPGHRRALPPKTPVKYITLLFLLQEKRELLSPGLPATSITKKMLSGKKNLIKRIFFQGFSAGERTVLYQFSSVSWLFCLSGVLFL